MNQPVYLPADQSQQTFASPLICLFVVVEYDMNDVPCGVHPMPSEVEGHLKVEELTSSDDSPRRAILSGPWLPGESISLSSNSVDRVMRVERNKGFIF